MGGGGDPDAPCKLWESQESMGSIRQTTVRGLSSCLSACQWPIQCIRITCLLPHVSASVCYHAKTSLLHLASHFDPPTHCFPAAHTAHLDRLPSHPSRASVSVCCLDRDSTHLGCTGCRPRDWWALVAARYHQSLHACHLLYTHWGAGHPAGLIMLKWCFFQSKP